MTCLRCGADNAMGAKFCVRCGAELLAEAGRSGAPPVLGLAGGAPALAPPPTQPTETSGKAIGSLICGIFFLVFPAAVAAIILGHLSLSDIRKAAGRLKGRGMATAGLVLGYSGVLAIPFLLIVAAIAIPNLLRAKMAANEASAVGSLRIIHTAAIEYSAKYRNGFAPDLATLDGAGAGAASCDRAQLIDSVLGTGQKAGYIFTYVPTGQRILWSNAKARGCSDPGAAYFEVHADPITRGTTGQRSFYTDQTAIIRWDENGPATADSPPLE